MEADRPTPPPDATQHRRKRAAQWRCWQNDIIPNLLPVFTRTLHATKSLRECDHLKIPAANCACIGTNLKIAIVHFTSIEDIQIKVCPCHTAAEQLMQVAAFPCSPLKPTLAVDLRVLEFTMNLFLQVAPNNTAFSLALERVLANMGYQLDHQNSLRRRFGSCLMWYTHLRNLHKAGVSQLVEAARLRYLPEEPPQEPQPLVDPPAAAPAASAATPATPEGSPSSSLPPRGRNPRRKEKGRRRASSSTTPTPGDNGGKRAREHTPEAPPLPFPEPPPRTRPSEYLRRRCPLCFGGLKHDPSLIADLLVCIDACFTQKGNKAGRDPLKTHPNTHFVPEDVAARTEAYVDAVRNGSGTRKRQRATVQEVEEEDGYDDPALPLPRSVLDGCEASFKAADEKREKASTQYFQDTAVMALLCRHDRVLWLVNMHSAGEKQFNVVLLMETLFQHLPPEITVGLLYDVACSMERSCRKWGFLGRYIDRIAFAVSVFHAFGHEWPCQLYFHPRKRVGFGLTDGEGCERFWHSISHLIAHLRICGYHNRLYTLDAQIEHADEASLMRLGEWIRRRHLHTARKRTEAQAALREAGKPLPLLREQWAVQVAAQTKPLPRRSKNRGERAVNAIILLRAAIKTRQRLVADLRRAYLEAVDDEGEEASSLEMKYRAEKGALEMAEGKLRKKEAALGVIGAQALKKLSMSEYIRFKMNAYALKRRLRDRLRCRKFEMDKVERSFRRLVNDQKLYSHTESAVKRREPTISKLGAEYNKMCAQIVQLIKGGKAPRQATAPAPIPAGQLWKLDVDDEIWQDVGFDDEDDAATEPPQWMADEKVRAGIKAMLQLDRCDEEDIRLRMERCGLQVWFAEQWDVVELALEESEWAAEKYQLELLRDNLVKLCATWQKWLPDLGIDASTLPPWGPTAGQLARCKVDMHLPRRGENRHYRRQAGPTSDDDDDEEEEEAYVMDETGGEEADFETLDTLATADAYRQGEDEEEILRYSFVGRG
ncbi:hypothetical protein C8R43DRAFT_1091280 [Mycena crocata]|nr:hypothetical protein C8R43DRAFT_1091280 [Mycena crocata]